MTSTSPRGLRATTRRFTATRSTRAAALPTPRQDDFDKADGEDLLGNLGADDDASGQIVYSRPGGVNVTVDWLAERSDAYGATKDCVFAGTARVLGQKSPDSLKLPRRCGRWANPLPRARAV